MAVNGTRLDVPATIPLNSSIIDDLMFNEGNGLGAATIRRAGFVLACLAAAMPAQAQTSGGSTSADSMTSVLVGAYTTGQATQGERVYSETCGNCHATSQFHGTTFQRVWHNRPVYSFFDQLRLMMPMDNPGGLSNEEYAAVVAYILKLNGYPSGEEPLPSDDAALRRIRFERRDGSTP